jgi:hypothetical protein
MSACLPGADDTPSVFAPGVDEDVIFFVYLSEGGDAPFGVILPVIFAFDQRICEDHRCADEIDAMLF